MKDNLKKTINSLFMVPTLGVHISTLKVYGYIGGFSSDKHHLEAYSNAVYLLFKPNNLDSFKDFLNNEYEKGIKIIEDYNYDKEHVVVVYELDPDFKQDFDLIRKGKYSKTSTKFQKLFNEHVYIIKDGKKIKENSIQYKIFNKTQDLEKYWVDKIGQELFPDQEYWDMYDEDNELLKL